jgi:ketosteroid isomerase-like protein
MPTIVSIEQPITGREQLGDVTEPQEALARFYRAFNTRDLAMMEDNWEHSDQPVIIGPLGGITRGWREIHALYERYFEFPGKVQAEFFDYTLHVFGDLFYAVGRERGQYTANHVNLKLAAIRTTNIFRRTSERQWKQIHHHVSFGDAQLAAAYQKAREAEEGVRGLSLFAKD